MEFSRVDVNYIDRATNRLLGILTGISIDYKLEDSEIFNLEEWLSLHEPLFVFEPFKSLKLRLDEILADRTIDEEEREDLLDWCERFTDPESFPMQSTTFACQKLHGVLQGIGIDNKITEDEVRDLHDWILEYS